jgi:hypothetical protein
LVRVDGEFTGRDVIVTVVVDVDKGEDSLGAGCGGGLGADDFVHGVAAGEVGGLVDAHFGAVDRVGNGGSKEC